MLNLEARFISCNVYIRNQIAHAIGLGTTSKKKYGIFNELVIKGGRGVILK